MEITVKKSQGTSVSGEHNPNDPCHGCRVYLPIHERLDLIHSLLEFIFHNFILSKINSDFYGFHVGFIYQANHGLVVWVTIGESVKSPNGTPRLVAWPNFMAWLIRGLRPGS